MTKRKASIALDNINEGNPNDSLQDGTNNNSSKSDLTNSTGGSSDIQHQNGTSASVIAGGTCQQHDPNIIQNDNSIGSNSSENNNSVCGNQHQKGKKERADNWSTAEIQVLHKGIETRRDLFYGTPSQATKKNRDLAWEAITREVNSVSSTPRSLNQVMKKFKNEKCRAKRKFEPDKEGHGNSNNSNSNNIHNSNNTLSNNNLGSNNNVSNSSHNDSTNARANSGATNSTTSNTNPSAQNHTINNLQQQTQAQQQSHHMTSAHQPMSVPQPSINVVKLAPQNVAKTMIDLPGHVQQIQMPNDDMVLIVPPDMDGLLSGVNIVSDGNGHHHFQKCSSSNALNNHPHNHQNQHPLQALNTSQGLVNGTMSNGMMARTIPAGSMCSLVYSTGNEVCAPEQHLAQNIVNQTSLTPHHLGLNAQNLTHHRGPIDQSHVQQQHHQHLQQHHQQTQQQQQQQHQHQPQQQQQQQQLQQQLQQQQQQPPPKQQPQLHAPHQPQLSNSHNQQHFSQSHLTTTTANTSGVVVESQLKNLLFNLLLKDGQHPSMPAASSNIQDNKHKNDMLTIIANSLTKIEDHLSKISKVASSLVAQNISLGDGNNASVSNQMSNSVSGSLDMSSDGNNNSLNRSGTGSNQPNSRRDNER